MALSLQEMSDRFEIQDMLYQYADIIDRKAVDELNDIFTADAHIDYSAFGGSVGDRPSTLAFLKEALPAFSASQHLNANVQICVEVSTPWRCRWGLKSRSLCWGFGM